MDELDFLGMLDNTSISITDYQYFHQLFHNRTIVFNGAVDEDIIEKYYLPLLDFEKDDSTKPVTLILNSFGGSVTEGFFFAHYLSQYKKPLNIIVTGCAASMAAIILAAGNKNPNITRYCYPSSYALIHDGYTAIGASESKTASDIMAFNDSVDDDIRDFIIENTNITAEEYDAHTRHQWFLKSDAMKSVGLIDKIIGKDDD